MPVEELIDMLSELPDGTQVYLKAPKDDLRGYTITGLARAKEWPLASILGERVQSGARE